VLSVVVADEDRIFVAGNTDVRTMLGLREVRKPSVPDGPSRLLLTVGIGAGTGPRFRPLSGAVRAVSGFFVGDVGIVRSLQFD
jgi:hypothetical protein